MPGATDVEDQVLFNIASDLYIVPHFHFPSLPHVPQKGLQRTAIQSQLISAQGGCLGRTVCKSR
jgi:hypothetical protein